MGISVRKRRRIQYGGQNYIWWVVPNDDDCDQIYLNIISEDKKIILACPIGDENYTVISKGAVLFRDRKLPAAGSIIRFRLTVHSCM